MSIRQVPDRWAALVTVQAPTSWQKASMAIYGPLSSAEVDVLAPVVVAIPGATIQVMPLDPLPTTEECVDPACRTLLPGQSCEACGRYVQWRRLT